jgi:hypothetical protein
MSPAGPLEMDTEGWIFLVLNWLATYLMMQRPMDSRPFLEEQIDDVFKVAWFVRNSLPGWISDVAWLRRQW